MPEVVPKHLTNPEPFATVTVEVSKGPNFYQLNFRTQDGKKRCIVTEEFDMSDKAAHRNSVIGLSQVISYVIQKKVWPKDTIIYSDPIKTDKGTMQNVVGWPEDLTEEQKKQYRVTETH